MKTNCIKPVGLIQDNKGEYHDVSCKMRNCPVCSKVLRNQLMNRVKTFFGDQQTYFNTLTIQINDDQDIMKYWAILRKRIKYYYPYLLIFWVKEYTKRGKAHLHFISSRALDGAWIQNEWYRITGTSFIVKCGNTTGEIRNPAAYMLKYMTKCHNNLDLYQKGERIYGFNGARAPPVELLGFESKAEDFLLYQHYNIYSNYWTTWYNEKQALIGPLFISYINYITSGIITKERINKNADIVPYWDKVYVDTTE